MESPIFSQVPHLSFYSCTVHFIHVETFSVENDCGLLQLKQTEVATLVSGLTDSSVLSAGGIHLGGQKYIYLRSDDTQIQGRKGDGGCSIAKANTCTYEHYLSSGITWVTWGSTS